MYKATCNKCMRRIQGAFCIPDIMSHCVETNDVQIVTHSVSGYDAYGIHKIRNPYMLQKYLLNSIQNERGKLTYVMTKTFEYNNYRK